MGFDIVHPGLDAAIEAVDGAAAIRPASRWQTMILTMSLHKGRDRRLLSLLDRRTPTSVTEVSWARPLRISTYVGAADLPDELVTSVRCLVVAKDDIVVCTTAAGRVHTWPGGRRVPDEDYEATAAREVHEETGWLIDRDGVAPIGFLHLYNLGEPLAPYPHPDTLQLVVVASASTRAAEDWSDVEGYEVSSRLVPLNQAQQLVSAEEPMCLPFLQHVLASRAD